MRKQWLAVLSILGLAGSSTPASAQLLKGAQKTDSNSQSTLKKSKLSQEDAASKDASTFKSLKYGKAGGDETAQASGIDKGQKAKAELKASHGTAEHKGQKAMTATGTTAHGSGGGTGKVAQQEIRLKAQKNASELKASQNEATIKLTNAEKKKQVNAASPK